MTIYTDGRLPPQSVTNTATPTSQSNLTILKLKGFRAAQINIASLLKHYEELLIYMHDQPFDILTLNETRLDCSILDCEVQIPGYDIIRSDRNRYGGGVAIYIRTVTPYIIRKDLLQDTLELLSIEVIGNLRVNQCLSQLGIDHQVQKLND